MQPTRLKAFNLNLNLKLKIKIMNTTIYENFLISLKIMAQGMEGIFVVIILITLVVLALGKLK